MKDKKMSVFRFLVVAQIMLVVSVMVGPETEGSIAVGVALEGMDEDAQGMVGLLLLVSLVGWAAASVGLLMLKNWARWIFLVSEAVIVALCVPLIGLRLTFLDGPEGTIGTVLLVNILYMSLVSHADAFD